MKYLYLLIFLSVPHLAFSQAYQGKVQEDYSIKVKRLPTSSPTPRQNPNTPEQIAGFPKGFSANANTKNFRNVALSDINGDGVEDILFAAGNRFMVVSNQEVLWTNSMTGVGIYPPSIADIDNDGDLEIVQVTGGNGQKGKVYAMDHLGNNLPGFPKSYNDNWILTTAALSDLDGDQQMEIIFVERNPPGGNIHVIKNDGTSWSKDWPLRLPGTPAITPSVADIDNDGAKEIVVSSTTVLYAFDLQGELEEGWPVDNPDTKFSFQSPILVDLDGDQDLEIVGASHGVKPEYYILHHDGTPYKTWPFFVPELEWTFSTPSIVTINEEQQILMSRPKNGETKDMLYAWNEAGDLQSGFPIESESGFQGIISVANVDEDPEMEYIFGSNRLDEQGFGFIHAANADGSGEVEGFPLRPKGWTLMNGAALGDVDGDGNMDLTALSYTTNFGASPDSVFLNVYNLATPYLPEKILWTTYKGSNRRDGNMGDNLVSSLPTVVIEGLSVDILPNPIIDQGSIQLKVNSSILLKGDLWNSNGQFLSPLFNEYYQKGVYQVALPPLANGIYFLKIRDSKNGLLVKKIIVNHW